MKDVENKNALKLGKRNSRVMAKRQTGEKRKIECSCYYWQEKDDGKMKLQEEKGREEGRSGAGREWCNGKIEQGRRDERAGRGGEERKTRELEKGGVKEEIKRQDERRSKGVNEREKDIGRGGG